MQETDTHLQIICLRSEAFYRLIETVVDRLKEDRREDGERWIGDKEAMSLLQIKSKSTLQHYRDLGKIRFSQPSKKVILYDRLSIMSFIECHVKEPFS